MVNTLAESPRYYKTALTNAPSESPIQSVFIHTHIELLAENYMVLTLARHIKHSNTIAQVFAFAKENLQGVQTQIITWVPPALQNNPLYLKAPLCIEVDHAHARAAITALYSARKISKPDYIEICQSLRELERCVARL